MVSLALFDLAGTLTDPVPGLIASHRFALSEVGLDFDALVETETSLSAEHLVRAPVTSVYSQLGVPADVASQTVQSFKQRHVLAGWLEDELLPGVDELLLALLDAGWMLGVATPQLEGIAVRVIDKIGIANRFAFVAGIGAPRTRRDLHMVISAHVSALAEAPDGMAVIGDRADNMALAKTLQATAIGAAWGFGSIEELMAADADAIAVTPADVVELLID